MAGSQSTSSGNGPSNRDPHHRHHFDIIYRHGCPDTIISDNGPQFGAKEFQEMCKNFGIRHRTMPIYTPQCNPVERTNRTIKTMIAQYIDKKHRRWDEHLGALRFAFNTAQHDATRFSPAFLNHGRELARPHQEDRRDKPPIPPPSTVAKVLTETHELVKMHLAQAFQRQESHYNLRRRAWRPQLGETVWKREHLQSDKTKAFNAKLAPKYSGPFTVKKIHSPVIVDLKDERGRIYKNIHVHDMRAAPDNKDREINTITFPTTGNEHRPTRRLTDLPESSRNFEPNDYKSGEDQALGTVNR
ncbi:uncharacterized protein K02A2.6-like [Harpegnathos saltator]|uniref:uncharacterized protein K02A2.6-like n=1 Tax=Harpegnathos saltator TaxID=610380 RepID=UPI000DBED588|nr:uncharacterized protein K02A2.6-like [Harpegnathos saltator]